MGCGGSKKDVHEGINNHPSGQIKSTGQQGHGDGREDDDVQVLEHGKTIPKSKLDELTENNSISKQKTEKIVNNSTSIKESHSVNDSKALGINSKTIHEPEKKEVEIKKEEHLEKAQTSKVEFDKHPHEFDFSFIEEKPKSKPNNEHDLLTDQVLKEMSELN
ncbi:hypothetical protein SteCoe_33112 [Stentor coeruleus]|uniref:Uncharacterized protein n=1 Tax=Stentor coeruleus TaxID=5963 RepID=A0A1R2AXI8_9CILI|nr:hypothetical protein SteCoe_33112 [Stentor coeruleus]